MAKSLQIATGVLFFIAVQSASAQIVEESKVRTSLEHRLQGEAALVVAEVLGPPLETAQCRIQVVRPPFGANAEVDPLNHIECNGVDASAEPFSFWRGLGESPIEYFGTRWKKHDSFMIRGRFAERLRPLLRARLADGHALVEADVVCDRTFDFCVEGISILRGVGRETQVSCSRWTELDRSAEFTLADFEKLKDLTPAGSTESHFATIDSQLASSKRKVITEFCVFHE